MQSKYWEQTSLTSGTGAKTLMVLTASFFPAVFPTVTCWAELDLGDISNVFSDTRHGGPIQRTFVQTRMRPSRGTNSGFLVVADERHYTGEPGSTDTDASSAAVNLHVEGERPGPDLIVIPADQLE